MPKTVENPIPNFTAGAANIEDVTQPMGPLEKGDQAIVDALHRLPDHTGMDVRPATELVARDPDGTVTRIIKDGSYKQEMASAHTMRPDGSSESVSTLMNPIPGTETISVTKTEQSADKGSHSVHVSGNKVAEGGDLTGKTDRAQAQAIKLEVADKIDAVTKRMSEEQIQDPALARDMADAEKPYRDRIAERKKEVAAAKKVADLAVRNYVDNVGDVMPEDLERTQTDETITRAGVARANDEDMDRANEAAKAVHEAHETRP
jgi:hypothetical protein